MNERTDSSKIVLRAILPSDAEAYWSLRLEALKSHPESFGASYEMSVLIPLEEVRGRIHTEPDDYILGAYSEEGLLAGMMGFKREQGLKLKHKAFIWGVYVSPQFRGCGIASGLLKEVLERGNRLDGLQQINLSVVTSNESAKRLYEQHGFEVYGIEKNALVVQDQGYDEAHMTYFYDKLTSLAE